MPFSLDSPPDENEIECARCGAYVHIEYTRCPNCGVNLYEPEDEGQFDGYVEPDWENFPHQSFFNRIGYFIRRLIRKPYRVEEVFGEGLDQAILYNDLLQKAGGDRGVVERLINFERQRNPHATRIVLLQDAIASWERDNRGRGSQEG